MKRQMYRDTKVDKDTELFNKLKDEFLNTLFKKGDKSITEAAKGLF